MWLEFRGESFGEVVCCGMLFGRKRREKSGFAGTGMVIEFSRSAVTHGSIKYYGEGATGTIPQVLSAQFNKRSGRFCAETRVCTCKKGKDEAIRDDGESEQVPVKKSLTQ